MRSKPEVTNFTALGMVGNPKSEILNFGQNVDAFCAVFYSQAARALGGSEAQVQEAMRPTGSWLIRSRCSLTILSLRRVLHPSANMVRDWLESPSICLVALLRPSTGPPSTEVLALAVLSSVMVTGHQANPLRRHVEPTCVIGV